MKTVFAIQIPLLFRSCSSGKGAIAFGSQNTWVKCVLNSKNGFWGVKYIQYHNSGSFETIADNAVVRETISIFGYVRYGNDYGSVVLNLLSVQDGYQDEGGDMCFF